MSHLARVLVFSLLLTVSTLPARSAVDSWTSAGPEGGDISVLVVDPVTPSTIYAGTNGGVFKSVDGGANWTQSSDGVDSSYIASMAIDPTSQSTLYTGTTQDGAFKSLDGGSSWFALPGRDEMGGVLALEVDPTSPNVVYAATIGGVFKSVTGGGDWSQLDNAPTFFVPLIELDPANPSTVFAGTSSGVFKSTDGGATWSEVGPFTFDSFRSIVVHPTTPDLVYLSTDADVYKSIDGGESWNVARSGLPSTPIDVLAIDPLSPEVLYAGTRGAGVYKSTDGAATWSPAQQGLSHLEARALAIDPQNSGTVYVGTSRLVSSPDGQGVFKSTDGGANWTATNRGLTATSILSLATGGSAPFPVVAGRVGGDVLRSSSQAAGWEVGRLDPQTTASISDLEFLPLSSIFFAATAEGVFKSDDDGESWEPTGFGPTLVQDLEVTFPGLVTVYAASRRDGIASVYKSTNLGASWIPTGPEDTFGLESLAVDPVSPSTLYVGSNFGEVFRSTDAGETWSRRDDGLDGSEIIYALAVTPTKVLAGTLNGLFETTDGGASWNLVTRDFIAESLAVDPVTPEVIYAGTFFRGVQRSVDGGATWSDFNTGMNHQRVGKLAIDSSPLRRIYAATEGGGVFFRDTNSACDESTVLCLHDERFQVTVDWKTDSLDGPAQAVPFGTSDSGIFTFFDDDNWELLVKVLDGCGLNQRFWVFSAATTNVEYTLSVTDRLTGESTSYFNPANTVASAITDTDALRDACPGLPGSRRPDGGAGSPSMSVPSNAAPSNAAPSNAAPSNAVPSKALSSAVSSISAGVATKETCTPSATAACVGENGRFRVEAEWRDFDDNEGPGRSVDGVPSDSSALFYFFGENNWEVLFKVLDACTFNDHFWFFAAATTNVEYTLRVTDTMTGAEVTYGNPLGIASPAITDTAAFPCP